MIKTEETNKIKQVRFIIFNSASSEKKIFKIKISTTEKKITNPEAFTIAAKIVKTIIHNPSIDFFYSKKKTMKKIVRTPARITNVSFVARTLNPAREGLKATKAKTTTFRTSEILCFLISFHKNRRMKKLKKKFN